MKSSIKSLGSAAGVEGCLIYCADDVYRIRVYNPDHSFTDYDIRTADLFFTINSEDAHFYADSSGQHYIDHDPQTLGIAVDTGENNGTQA